jgi:hypothetical protein
MGNQRLTRQAQRNRIPRLAATVGAVCHGPGRIDERNIAHDELHRLIIVDHGQLAVRGKEREVMVCTVEANIPISPLDPLSIGPNIERREAADGYRANPAGKGIGFDAFRVVAPTHRTEQISPRLVFQSWCTVHFMRIWHAISFSRSPPLDSSPAVLFNVGRVC